MFSKVKLLIVSLLGLCIYLSASNNASATGVETFEDSIRPYEKVMEKLTNEYGIVFYVSEEKKEHFYNSIKDMSPSEFEEMLTNQYKEFSVNNDYTNGLENTEKSLITPYSITESITQKAALNYSSSIYLKSTVFSSGGGKGTFTYQSISSYGTTWPAGFTGYHWEVDRKSHQLSSDKKSCTVTLRGHPENANGVALGLSLSVNHTFYAN
ncbi:hypothetical protein M3603_15405 [Rummeliibacillus stabekisii]|uniref:hypothetical protein n=1 Tax=Rummeliibacillus stabekisii TaxID=241244 RepID=UPI00203FEC1D|nr:hypothetical protein [Rummeliibacillus stabekisii]MCM3318004.1 hypothetical protein [Rummeliibacillus stabekisii]